MSGANWVRLLVTRADGQAQNNHVTLNMDVHDASAGVTDDWIFYGDSITQDGMSHDTRTPASGPPVASFSQLINASKPDFYPLFQNGGTGGLTSADGAKHVPGWITLFPGRYVALNYGTNDALTASPGDTSIAAAFHTHMKAMVQTVLAAGKVPIVPTIPWGANANLQANVPVLNAELAKLKAEIPEIVPGPDLYGYFRDHPSLIGDGIHPTWDPGYAAMRRLWAGTALSLYP
jgi:lysophospholipase L1-like esterase